VLTLSTVIAFTLIIGGVRAVGKSSSIAARDWIPALLTNPDGSSCQQPCLFGVQPGITNLSAALYLLQAHPFTRGLRQDATLSGQGMAYYAGDGLALIINH